MFRETLPQAEMKKGVGENPELEKLPEFKKKRLKNLFRALTLSAITVLGGMQAAESKTINPEKIEAQKPDEKKTENRDIQKEMVDFIEKAKGLFGKESGEQIFSEEISLDRKLDEEKGQIPLQGENIIVKGGRATHYSNESSDSKTTLSESFESFTSINKVKEGYIVEKLGTFQMEGSGFSEQEAIKNALAEGASFLSNPIETRQESQTVNGKEVFSHLIKSNFGEAFASYRVLKIEDVKEGIGRFKATVEIRAGKIKESELPELIIETAKKAIDSSLDKNKFEPSRSEKEALDKMSIPELITEVAKRAVEKEFSGKRPAADRPEIKEGN